MKVRLNALQIEIMQCLMKREYGTLKQISLELDKSQSRISSVVSDLENKGLVDLEKKGLSKKISVANSKHASILKKLFAMHPVDFENCLSGSALEVLQPITEDELSRSEVSKRCGYSERTVSRVFDRMRERGMIVEESGLYSINPRYAALSEFISEFQSYLNVKRSRSFSPTSTMIWERGKEFMVETRETNEEDYFLTGYDRLADFGVPLITTGSRYYFYTEMKDELVLEDVCLHTLIPDISSTRNLLYVLLAIGKNRVNWSYLKIESVKYGLEDTAAALKEYMDSRGKKKAKYFPPWEEYKTKAREYEIDV